MSDLRYETEHRRFADPDEVRAFARGRAEILRGGGAEACRLVFEPGWRSSVDVQPHAGSVSCEAPHVQYHGYAKAG